MVKKAARKKASTRPDDVELAKVNAQRAQARRLLAAEQNLRDLGRRLVRASSAANASMMGTARVLAAIHGCVVLDSEEAGRRAARIEELEATEVELRSENRRLRELTGHVVPTV